MQTRFFSRMAFSVAAALLAASPAFAVPRQGQDLLSGNGTDGPYMLGWKQILFGSETVTLNGQTLHWGADYTLDAAAGTITFTHPLLSNEAAVVRYGYDTATAQAQGSGLNVPLSFGVGQNLSISGVYNHSTTDQSNPGAVNVGVNGGWKNKHGGTLNAKMAYLPAMTGKDAQAAPNGLARMGMAVDGQTRLGSATELNMAFSRAGNGLGSVGGSDMQAGQQKISVGSTFTPNKAVQATLGYAQTDAAAAGKGHAQSEISAGLALAPSDKMHLQTGLTQSSNGSTPGSTQTLTASAAFKPTNKAELDADFSDKTAPGHGTDAQSLDIKTSIAASPKLALTADAGQSAAGPSGVTQSFHTGATLKPTAGSELDASFSQQNAPGQDHDTQGMDIKAALARGKVLALTAEMNQATQGTQDTNAQNVSLALTPQKALALHTSLVMQQNPTTDTQAANVSGTLQPNRFLQVSGGYTWRTLTLHDAGTTTPDAPASSTAQISFTPLSAFHLVGTYDQNPDEGHGVQTQADHGLSLQTSLGALSLTGGYLWTRQYASDATATCLQVGLGLRFSSNTQLTGNYKHSLTVGATQGGTDAYTVGLTRNLGQAFDLSVNGTMQQQMGSTTANPNALSASANLGMKF